MKKIWRFVLLVGNDWLLHVVFGWICVNLYGWFGLIHAFLSHFIVDAIPHGHVKNILLDSLKGIMTTIILIISTWINSGMMAAWQMSLAIFVSISFDFVLVAAKIADKKFLWAKISLLSGLIFHLVKLIIGLNYFCHWFGRTKSFQKCWKETSHHNCGLTGNGLGVSWWNIIQLIITFFAFGLYKVVLSH